MHKQNDTKRRIIEKTKSLLKMKPNITVRDIAEACYVNIAAVNYYFSSKENLLNIVMKETVDDLKTTVQAAMERLPEESGTEEALESMVNVIYNFAIDNMGIVSYMFLQPNTQWDSSNLIIEGFFEDNEFTEKVFAEISRGTGIEDNVILRARYMLLFSSFSIPIFIQMLQERSKSSRGLAPLKDPDFKRAYVSELVRFLK